MSQTLDTGDEGKTVRSADGEEIGTIGRVEHGTAYLDAEESLLDSVRSMLGEEEGEHTVVGTDVEEITDEEVRLRRHE